MDLPAIQALIDTCYRCIEIGGPTPGGYSYITSLGLRLPDFIITNLTNPVVLDALGANPQTYVVDEIADVTNWPYAAATVDMFLTSSFPRSLRATLIKNTALALRSGGLLVFENVLPEDDACATQYGFTPLLHNEAPTEHYTQIYQRTIA